LAAVRNGQTDALVGAGPPLMVRLADAEVRETHLKNVLMAIRNMNQLIVSVGNPKQLVEQSCQTLVETMGYFNAWTALFDHSERTVSITSDAGFNGGFAPMRERLLRGGYPDCLRKAVDQKNLVAVADPVSECPDCPLSRYYQGRAGLTHCLESQGRVYGILSVSVPATVANDQEEQALFTELARDLAFALHKIEILAEKEKLAAATDTQGRRLEALMQAMPTPVFFKDRAGRYLGCNVAFEALTGRSMAQITGKTVREVWPEKFSAIYRDRDLELLKSGGTQQYESKLVNTRGVERDVVFVKSVFIDPSRNVEGLVGVILDITEQKAAEKTMRQAEQFLRQVIDTSPSCIFVKNRKGRYELVNKAISDLYDLPPEAMIGKTDLELAANQHLGLPDAENFARDDLDVLEKKAVKRINEEVFTTADGSRRWFQTVKTPLVSDTFPECMLGVATDITTRKQAEQALRESEDKFRYIFDHSVVAKSITFPSGKFQPNDAFCEMLGYTREELAIKTWQDITHPEDVAVNQAEIAPILSGEKISTRFIKRYLHKNGDIIWADMGTSLRRDDRGNPMYLITAAVNITEQKQAELEQEKLQKQLIHSQKMESIGRLAGGVAHDFNNMLAVILGHGEMALEKINPDDPIGEDLTEIMTAAKRSAGLTGQLLAFARKQTITPRPLDLNDTLADMLKMLRRLIGEDIDLAWEPGAGLWPVMMDPSQIDQILANLCVNARDAIGGVGKIVIESENKSIDETSGGHPTYFIPGDYVMLAVTDNGLGMDKATLNNLFEPFFTTKGTGEGTGLGLATVYGIVKQNNGFINVYSEPGKGSIFRIYLPRHAGAMQTAEPEKTVVPPRGRGESVLVVDDEGALLKLTQKMLAGLGYHALAATDTASALTLARERKEPIDLLMTDVVMPEMNGLDLAGQIKKVHPDLKILFMSGYTADVIARRGILEKGMHFIQKPFSRGELAAKVRQALSE